MVTYSKYLWRNWLENTTLARWISPHLYILPRYMSDLLNLQLATTSNGDTSCIYTVYNSLWHQLSLLNLLCHQHFSDSDIQRQIFLLLWVRKLSPYHSHTFSGRHIVECLSLRHSWELSLRSRNLSSDFPLITSWNYPLRKHCSSSNFITTVV
jgi:hypothetical protein